MENTVKMEMLSRLDSFHLPLFSVSSVLLWLLGVISLWTTSTNLRIPVGFGQWKTLAGDQKTGGKETGVLMLLDPSQPRLWWASWVPPTKSTALLSGSPLPEAASWFWYPSPLFPPKPMWCGFPLYSPQHALHPQLVFLNPTCIFLNSCFIKPFLITLFVWAICFLLRPWLMHFLIKNVLQRKPKVPVQSIRCVFWSTDRTLQ